MKVPSLDPSNRTPTRAQECMPGCMLYAETLAYVRGCVSIKCYSGSEALETVRRVEADDRSIRVCTARQS